MEPTNKAYGLHDLTTESPSYMLAEGMKKKLSTSRFAPSWRCFSIESWPPENAYLFICRYGHMLEKRKWIHTEKEQMTYVQIDQYLSFLVVWLNNNFIRRRIPMYTGYTRHSPKNHNLTFNRSKNRGGRLPKAAI